jgi:transposase-like protein
MQRRVFSKELKIEAVKLSKREIRGDCEVPRDLAAAMAMRPWA